MQVSCHRAHRVKTFTRRLVPLQHEEEVIDGDTGFVAYESRFWYPAEESGSHSPFYYSYETGPLHVVMLGCYVEYTADSEQAAWLRRDLASVDRQRTPWVVVGMHVSPYLCPPSRPPAFPHSVNTLSFLPGFGTCFLSLPAQGSIASTYSDHPRSRIKT